MANGAPVPGAPDPLTGFHGKVTGTYTVYPDCTGAAGIDVDTPIGPARISLMFVLGDGSRTIHTIVRALAPPTGEPALPSIHSDAQKLGVVPSAFWLPPDPN
jgi:hypothetical protein